MPMFKCPVHGLTYVALCCRQLSEAFDANRPAGTTIVIDDWGDPYCLCAGCHASALAVPPVNGRRGDNWPLRHEGDDSLVSGECGACFAAWLKNTDGGDLDKRVQEARERGDLL
jgi:hypothetical protein